MVRVGLEVGGGGEVKNGLKSRTGRGAGVVKCACTCSETKSRAQFMCEHGAQFSPIYMAQYSNFFQNETKSKKSRFKIRQGGGGTTLIEKGKKKIFETGILHIF